MNDATFAPGESGPHKARKPTSPRRRVFRLVAVVSLPLVAIACALMIWGAREHRASLAERRAFRAEAAAMALHADLNNNLTTLRSLAVSPSLTQGVPNERVDDYLDRYLAANPDWDGLALFDERGTQIGSTSNDPPIDIGRRPYFRELVQTGKPVISARLPNGATSAPTLVLAVPVHFDGGGRGALAASHPIADLEATLAPYVERGGSISVIDRNGMEVLSLRAQGTRVIPDANLEKRVPIRNATTEIVDGPDGRHLVLSWPVKDFALGVVIAEPASAVFRPAWARLATESSLLTIGLALMAAGAWYFGGKLALYTKRAEDARARAERAQEKLADALRTRDWVLAAASHDLRNPLSTVHLTAQFLRSQLSGSEPPTHEQVDAGLARIAGAGKAMSSLIDSLLDVARLQMGKPLNLNRCSVDLVGLATGVITERQRLTSRHALRLVTDGDGLVGNWDRMRMERVLINLIDNAVKYSPDGGDVLVRLHYDKAADSAVIEVEDHGIGIPRHDLGPLFSRFFRGANVGGIPGTGMGLASVKRIVEEHQGSITVESTPGVGSLFTVRVPRSGGKEAPAQQSGA